MTRTHIGPYKVVGKVGEGGMGEVFRGWDPRLEREVAIKLLHPEAGLNPDRQRRLLAEGRAASALNHPNILRVYDVDVDGDSYYLVSEWLDGKSLRDELSRGPLPLKRLLDLSVQVADGLAAAHSIGVVHRDIKPENVMLARDGTARIVDFGLARSDAGAFEARGGETSTMGLEGGLSGTPAYMSPEQARGNAGDFRTDLFSFGALVYEMATGTFAFRRDTVADTLSAVLHEEPPPIADLNPRVPAPFRWIIERCLAKDASDRYAASEDLARELRWVRDRLSEVLAEPKVSPAASPSRRGAWRLVAGSVVAVIAGAAIATTILIRSQVTPHHRFTPLATASGFEGAPAWSPDGQSVAYLADVDGVQQVFVRRLSTAVSTQITQGRFDAAEPVWAPDGEHIYYVALAGEHESLWSVGAAGGRPDLLLDNVSHLAVNPRSQRFALLRVEENVLIQRLWWWTPGAEPVREPRKLVNAEDGFGLGGQLQFSPDGQKLLMWALSASQVTNERPSRFHLIPIEPTGQPREVLTQLVSSASLTPFHWLPDSRYVVIDEPDPVLRNRHLWFADTESDAKWQLTSTHTNETFPAVSPDGARIAYASEEVDFDLVSVAPDGRNRQTALATSRNEFDPAWSPAGDQFAFVTDRTGAVEIWLRRYDGQWERPVVTQADFGESRTDTLGSLAFSPDGKRLAYQRRGPDQSSIWITAITGGTPVPLLKSESAKNAYQDTPSWSPDGEWIAFIRSDGGTFSAAKIRVGSTQPVPLVDNVLVFSRVAWSPDGRWIACETADGLSRVPSDGGRVELIAAGPWMAFTWAPDSRHLFVLGESETPGHFALVEVDAATQTTRFLNPDLGPIPVANQPVRGLSFSKDHGFLTSLASARSDIWLLEGFQRPGAWWENLLGRGRGR